MNLIGPTLLTPYDLAGIVADVAGIIGDADTATELVFTTTGARSYSPGTGQADYAEASVTVNAWISDCTQAAMTTGAMPGDIQALIAFADIDTPASNDRFVIGSGARAGHYSIRKVVIGPLATHHLFYAYRTD